MRVVLAIVAALAVSLTASTALSATKKPKIKEMSHLHPKKSKTSFVCAKVKGKPGQRIRALLLFGPGGLGGMIDDDKYKLPGKKAPKKKQGKLLLSWEIDSAGPYELRVGKAQSEEPSDEAGYTVPNPPPEGDEQGPFTCPAKKVTKGWG